MSSLPMSSSESVRAGAPSGADALFRATFEGAPIGMAVVADDGTLLEGNDALARIAARPREKLAGLPLGELFEPTSPDGLEALRATIAGESDSYRAEGRCPRPGEDPAWVRLSLSAAGVGGEEQARLVAQIEDLSERQALIGRLDEVTDHDPLTGLRNRRRFETEIERLAQGRRHGDRPWVAVAEVDGMSAVNDNHGHHAGDELLQALAASFRDELRDEDLVGRVGGDEFGLAFHAPDAGAATATLQRLVRAANRLAGERQAWRFITLSVGVAPLDPSGAEAGMRAAEQALRAVGRAGGAGVKLAAETLL